LTILSNYQINNNNVYITIIILVAMSLQSHFAQEFRNTASGYKLSEDVRKFDRRQYKDILDHPISRGLRVYRVVSKDMNSGNVIRAQASGNFQEVP
jgi:hypothetical protein